MKKIACIKAVAFIMSILLRVLLIPFIFILNIFKITLRIVHTVSNMFVGISNRIKQYCELQKQQKKEKVKRRKKEHKKRIRTKKYLKTKKSKKTKRKKVRPLRWYDNTSKETPVLVKMCAILIWLVRLGWHQIYWGSYWVCRKVYWGSHWAYSKVYWGTKYIFQKIYWGSHWVYRKIYWGTRYVFQKIYWKLYTILNRLFWFLYVRLQKLYWLYYVQSRKIYFLVTKNDYVDLLFIFMRHYLTKSSIDIRFLKIQEILDYVKNNSHENSYHMVENGRKRPVCIPAFFMKSKEDIQLFVSPDIYVANIRNVDIIGGTNVIVANEVLLNDAVANDKDGRIDIRYSAIKKVLGGVAIISDSDVVETIQKGINLVGAASFNYYHLVVEILSRLTFVDTIEQYRDYPILVDEVVLRIPQFSTALRCINQYQHPVFIVEKEKKYHINEAVLPSSNVWMPTNLYNRDTIRVEDFLISDTVLYNIRRTVGVWEKEAPWRKVFISRKNTQAVRLLNENQVRSIFMENGFEIVYTEEMTFEQQVECFGQAKCIVGTSGAALTNTIFCQKGTIIGCIIPEEHRFYMYSTIAYLLDMIPIFLDAHITERTPYAAADSFELDLEYVRKYIRYIDTLL